MVVVDLASRSRFFVGVAVGLDIGKAVGLAIGGAISLGTKVAVGFFRLSLW